MPKRKLNKLAVYLVIVLVLVGGGVLTAHLISPLLIRLNLIPNDKIVNFHEYYTLDPDTAVLIWEDSRLISDNTPLYENGEAYLPIALVQEYIDPFIFMDEYAGSLFVSSQSAVLEFKAGEFLKKDETVYIPASLLSQLYPYRIEYRETNNIITVDEITGDTPGMAKVIKKTGVRYAPETMSEMALELEIDEIVMVYKPLEDESAVDSVQEDASADASSQGEFTKIRTKDGLPGYVLTADIQILTAAEADSVETPPVPPPLTGEYIVNGKQNISSRWPVNEKVNMMWDGIFNEAGTAVQMNEPVPAGVNVLSPTWYELTDDAVPQLSSWADDETSAAYMAWAHRQGVSVWPRFDDVGSERSKAVLTDPAQRKNLVERICAEAEKLDLDGVNIDFEHVPGDAGDYFIQFLRELSVGLSDRILSVDVLVPMDWSAYYRRDDIAMFADFLCLMAYDEHYPGGDLSGPVASLPFVSKGVADMLAVMPKEKLIMGLPFYNRVWIEITNTGEIKDTKAYGMEKTKQLLIENDVTQPEWNETIGSFYGEYAVLENKEFLMHRIWLEDENSIKEKLKIFKENDLAGVAGWYRGLENPAVHELLREACGE